MMDYINSSQALLVASHVYIRTALEVLGPLMLQFGIYRKSLLFSPPWISQNMLHELRFIKMAIISSFSWPLVRITNVSCFLF